MRALKSPVLKVDPENPGRVAIGLAADAIRRGALVVFPTETVYGIAANLLDRKAVRRLCEVKKRSRGKPFTVHIADVKTIRAMGCSIPGPARRAIGRFWPGPLTVILEAGDGRKIGFRMPANKVALALIRRSQVPVVAPSANISGNRPPASAAGAARELDGLVDLIIDSGATDVGIESTVADFTVDPPAILREGAVKRSALMRAARDPG